MTDKIIKFPTNFTPPLCFDRKPVNKVLLSADNENMDEIMAIGMKDGEVKIFTSETDVNKVLFLCEYAKALLMKSVIAGKIIQIK